MPFGLKNLGVVYHRLMDKVFKDQIVREVYVDNILVKLSQTEHTVGDLE